MAPTDNFKKLTTKKLSEFESETVEWFPVPAGRNLKIPVGMGTVIAGDTGNFKSGIWEEIVSKATRSHTYRALVVHEDPAGLMTKPRIAAMGGDTELIEIVEGKKSLGKNSSVYLNTDLEYFIGTLKEAKESGSPFKIVVVDPLASFAGEKADLFKGNSMRSLVDPYVKLAKEYDFALIIVIHFNKAVTKALYKLSDSNQLGAAVRSIYLVGQDPDSSDDSDKVICHQKCNIGLKGPSYKFKVVGDDPNDPARSSLVWGDETPLTAEELVAGAGEIKSKGGKLAACIAFTKGILTRGPELVSNWESECELEGYSESTRARAREALKLVSIPPDKHGPGGGAYKIALPGYENVAVPSSDRLKDHMVPQIVEEVVKQLVSQGIITNGSLRDHSVEGPLDSIVTQTMERL